MQQKLIDEIIDISLTGANFLHDSKRLPFAWCMDFVSRCVLW
ncbi:hypothetical protein E4J49_11375 [Vibrio parahaemolyticus]|nr:hypothetical protein D0871_06385 [Vibrio parahaemolyticus]EGQ8241518.1 hypothetical protein [Vibrio parahaemolyticus]EGQ8386327.1 hypothetical protein [Vibrio parahaemolyticus]EGQ9124817.1 hypothetical protein [Vibrio parahaemolyticus]EGQ9443163.1 hypothetical protein [Vibrio parahaemolyticus]